MVSVGHKVVGTGVILEFRMEGRQGKRTVRIDSWLRALSLKERLKTRVIAV